MTLREKWEAGKRVFSLLQSRQIDYRSIFLQPAGQNVLIDLADFCRAGETCVVLDKNGHVDQEKTLMLEGRREVWLRIANNLHLTPNQLYAVMTGQQFDWNPPSETEDDDNA